MVLPLHRTFRDFSSHILTGRFLEIFDLNAFCTPRRVSTNAHYKLGFDNAERYLGRLNDNRTQRFSDYLHILNIRAKIKVALAVDLSI